uniref:RING-type E3 ubiquitin transferase (cysteine targeting) n=1 Tax=Eptatretus burgeri TaxID=7764 RepID=A0A8C4QZ29_EPTBU
EEPAGSERSPSGTLLRVRVLDAAELDDSLEDLLWSQLCRCFQMFHPGLLSPWEPELRSILAFLLWQLSVLDKGATVGQVLFGIHYSLRAGGASPNRRDRLRLVWLSVIGRWLLRRAQVIAPSRMEIPGRSRAVALLLGLAHSVRLACWMVCLLAGGPIRPTEHLLGMHMMFSGKAVARQVSFEFTSRELLWDGFAQLLTCTFPLIHTTWPFQSSSQMFGHLQPRSTVADDVPCCTACKKAVTLPHTGNCSHLFCYYCLSNSLLSNPRYFTKAFQTRVRIALQYMSPNGTNEEEETL